MDWLWNYYIVIVLGALCLGLIAGIAMAKSAYRAKSKRQGQEFKASQQEEAVKVRRSLEHQNFKTVGGLTAEVDLESMLLKVVGELSSRSFPIDKDQSGSWHVYVYNRDGERRLMPKDDFEYALLEVRDEPRNREKQVGLDKRSKTPSASV